MYEVMYGGKINFHPFSNPVTRERREEKRPTFVTEFLKGESLYRWYPEDDDEVSHYLSRGIQEDPYRLLRTFVNGHYRTKNDGRSAPLFWETTTKHKQKRKLSSQEESGSPSQEAQRELAYHNYFHTPQQMWQMLVNTLTNIFTPPEPHGHGHQFKILTENGPEHGYDFTTSSGKPQSALSSHALRKSLSQIIKPAPWCPFMYAQCIPYQHVRLAAHEFDKLQEKLWLVYMRNLRGHLTCASLRCNEPVGPFPVLLYAVSQPVSIKTRLSEAFPVAGHPVRHRFYVPNCYSQLIWLVYIRNLCGHLTCASLRCNELASCAESFVFAGHRHLACVVLCRPSRIRCR